MRSSNETGWTKQKWSHEECDASYAIYRDRLQAANKLVLAFGRVKLNTFSVRLCTRALTRIRLVLLDAPQVDWKS